MQVSVIIPTMPGREDLLRKLLLSIPTKYEKIVVDDSNLLLAGKRNKGAMKSGGEYLLFIDDDNYLENWAIEEALQVVQEEGVGVVGLMACYDDKQDLVADGGSLRNHLTGFTKGVNTNAHWPSLCKQPYEVDEVANAFILHSELFYELYGFDEKNFPIDLDEADLCKRVKNMGFKVMICPEARCYHKSQTYSPVPDFRRPLNAYTMGRNKLYFQRKHLSFIRYMIYLSCFLWATVFAYSASLLYRKKPRILFYFLWGVFDGIFKPLMCGLPKSVWPNKKVG